MCNRRFSHIIHKIMSPVPSERLLDVSAVFHTKKTTGRDSNHAVSDNVAVTATQTATVCSE